MTAKVSDQMSTTKSSAVEARWIPEAMRWSTDDQSGAVIEQLTSEPVTSTNIYPEQRYASGDGSRIAISRAPFGRPAEVWVCDMNNLRLCRVGEGIALGGNPWRNAIYYVTVCQDKTLLMKLDLLALTTQLMAEFSGTAPRSGAVSPDERWFVGGPFLEDEPQRLWRLDRVDLSSGQTQPLCTVQDMFNPHLQFNPADTRQAIVQINRGGTYNLTRNKVQLSGKLGATLSLLDVQTGQVTALPIGRPHTPAISGHECWVGHSGQLIFTAGHYDVSTSAFVTLRPTPPEHAHLPPAAIYALKPGDEQARVVAGDLLYNHLAASDDGRFFIADDHASGDIHIGSLATGRHLRVCSTHARQGACQHSHVHAYLTPDNRYVVFNSTQTGSAQVMAARLPEGFLDRVLAL
jgi:hypothetical protein